MNDEKIKNFALEFKDLDHYEKEEVIRMLKAGDAFIALEEIGQEVFRPARKHGYSNVEINECLEKCGDHGTNLISLLEDAFYEILKDRNLLDHLY